MDGLVRFFTKLGHWVNAGSRETVDRGVKRMATDYRHRIKSGLDALGRPLAPLNESTLKAPVRMLDNSQIRETLGDTPLSATGETAASIRPKKVAFDTWEISPNSMHGKVVLRSNAKRGHSGSPFAGDTPKVVRDPLQVTDKQLDLMVDQILQDLDSVLRF